MKHKQSPNCNQSIAKNTLINRILKLLYVSSKDPNGIDTSSIKNSTVLAFLLLITGIIATEALVSLILYPILNAFIKDSNVLLYVFMFGHILLVPLYLKFGLNLTSTILKK